MNPVQFYKCLADETRLKCLLLIEQEGELCVCELMEALDDIQPKISRHLAQLRSCKILESHRRGQWMFYKLDSSLPAWAIEILQTTNTGSAKFLKADMKRLKNMKNRPDFAGACC